MHKELLSTPCTTKLEKKYFPVLLRTTKLARTTSQYYFVHLCTTKLAQSTSQYYFVLQSLHKRSPELLHTARLAQNTVQYYFVYYKAYTILLPSTTLFYKTCTKYFPILLLSSSIYFLLQDLHKILPSTPFLPIVLAPEVCTRKFLHTEAFTHRSFHTDREPFTQRSFYTEIAKPKNNRTDFEARF